MKLKLNKSSGRTIASLAACQRVSDRLESYVSEGAYQKLLEMSAAQREAEKQSILRAVDEVLANCAADKKSALLGKKVAALRKGFLRVLAAAPPPA